MRQTGSRVSLAQLECRCPPEQQLFGARYSNIQNQRAGRAHVLGKSKMADIGVNTEDYVTTVELQRPPNNFLDVGWIGDLADIYEQLDDDPRCRVIVLAAAGKHFCAGANLARRLEPQAAEAAEQGRHL
jgi:hypothetical protein